jgi:hypothetical protein
MPCLPENKSYEKTERVSPARALSLAESQAILKLRNCFVNLIVLHQRDSIIKLKGKPPVVRGQQSVVSLPTLESSERKSR